MTNFSLISLYVTAANEFFFKVEGAVWACETSNYLHCQQYLYLLNSVWFQEATNSSYVIKTVRHSGEIFVSF